MKEAEEEAARESSLPVIPAEDEADTAVATGVEETKDQVTAAAVSAVASPSRSGKQTSAANGNTETRLVLLDKQQRHKNLLKKACSLM